MFKIMSEKDLESCDSKNMECSPCQTSLDDKFPSFKEEIGPSLEACSFHERVDDFIACLENDPAFESSAYYLKAYLTHLSQCQE